MPSAIWKHYTPVGKPERDTKITTSHVLPRLDDLSAICNLQITLKASLVTGDPMEDPGEKFRRSLEHKKKAAANETHQRFRERRRNLSNLRRCLFELYDDSWADHESAKRYLTRYGLGPLKRNYLQLTLLLPASLWPGAIPYDDRGLLTGWALFLGFMVIVGLILDLPGYFAIVAALFLNATAGWLYIKYKEKRIANARSQR